MKVTLMVALCGLVLLGASGCSKSDPDMPKVDPVAAKSQPGATVPAAPPNGVTAAQVKAAKSGGD